MLNYSSNSVIPLEFPPAEHGLIDIGHELEQLTDDVEDHDKSEHSRHVQLLLAQNNYTQKQNSYTPEKENHFFFFFPRLPLSI